jgi:hypothetical protein
MLLRDVVKTNVLPDPASATVGQLDLPDLDLRAQFVGMANLPQWRKMDGSLDQTRDSFIESPLLSNHRPHLNEVRAGPHVPSIEQSHRKLDEIRILSAEQQRMYSKVEHYSTHRRSDDICQALGDYNMALIDQLEQAGNEYEDSVIESLWLEITPPDAAASLSH